MKGSLRRKLRHWVRALAFLYLGGVHNVCAAGYLLGAHCGPPTGIDNPARNHRDCSKREGFVGSTLDISYPILHSSGSYVLAMEGQWLFLTAEVAHSRLATFNHVGLASCAPICLLGDDLFPILLPYFCSSVLLLSSAPYCKASLGHPRFLGAGW